MPRRANQSSSKVVDQYLGHEECWQLRICRRAGKRYRCPGGDRRRWTDTDVLQGGADYEPVIAVWCCLCASRPDLQWKEGLLMLLLRPTCAVDTPCLAKLHSHRPRHLFSTHDARVLSGNECLTRMLLSLLSMEEREMAEESEIIQVYPSPRIALRRGHQCFKFTCGVVPCMARARRIADS